LRRKRTRQRHNRTLDILFCVADHFEPAHGAPDAKTERARVSAWVNRYPVLADRFRDADGRPPRHTFFFPEEGYRAEHLDALAGLCTRGYGDVDVHLHHDGETSGQLRERLQRFTETLFHRHGLLRKAPDGAITFGFIHGNWALDNARPDGKWCGVNDELTILRKCGCYADFTLPAAPDASQTRTVNSIYYATDDPLRPRSHEFGIPASVHHPPPKDALLLIQGPLAFDFSRRIWGCLPGLENAALDASTAHLPTLSRFRSWVDVAVGVEGQSDWIFVKVHTHGAVEANASVLLGETMARFHGEIGRAFNDGRAFRLHYVTAHEMFSLVKAAEAGHTGNPGTLLLSPSQTAHR